MRESSGGWVVPAREAPGVVCTGLLGDAGRSAVRAEVAARQAVLLVEEQVTGGLDLVAVAAAALERVRLRLAVEVAARGVHTAAGFGLVDWLGLRCPDLARGAVLDLARVALAAQEGVHAPLVHAVLSGGMSVARAARLHRALVRVRRAVGPVEYGQAVGLLAGAGCEAVFEDADVDRVVGALLRACVPEADHESRARAVRELRDVHESSLADGSVRRVVITFGDSCDYEAVRAVLTSPLAAPAGADEREATGEVDLRTPGQRRYDALITVLRRGVAGTAGQPTTAKAVLVVTMDLATLRRDLAAVPAGAGGGRLPGCGSSLEGRDVPVSQVRRLACEADLVPMVLGGPSEVVDQGRRVRLVTPGQRLRLATRDGGCTIPGCTVPATWCEAHHVIPWAAGGASDLSNYAL
ncbi:DUF222 domain-containing protein, partial [Actinosynnema sp.]|uniref:HNH endonuclease signature motif containing protein n=1 Tax=Actinosynnema sp. TaxID=1872144 RepID=UPI003F85052D